jgi:hypothetical protein
MDLIRAVKSALGGPCLSGRRKQPLRRFLVNPVNASRRLTMSLLPYGPAAGLTSIPGETVVGYVRTWSWSFVTADFSTVLLRLERVTHSEKRNILAANNLRGQVGDSKPDRLPTRLVNSFFLVDFAARLAILTY